MRLNWLINKVLLSSWHSRDRHVLDPLTDLKCPEMFPWEEREIWFSPITPITQLRKSTWFLLQILSRYWYLNGIITTHCTQFPLKLLFYVGKNEAHPPFHKFFKQWEFKRDDFYIYGYLYICLFKWRCFISTYSRQSRSCMLYQIFVLI